MNLSRRKKFYSTATIFEYSEDCIKSEVPGSSSRWTLIIHPSPYGSELTNSGSSSNFSLTSFTVPATGMKQVRHGFNGLHRPEYSVSFDTFAKGFDFYIYNITQLRLSVIGNAYQ